MENGSEKVLSKKGLKISDLGHKIITFNIPFLPPSVNSIYGIKGGRKVKVFLTSDARQFKEKAKMFMPYKTVPAECKLALEIDINAEWYFKNGNVRKLDIQNLEKILIDAIAEKYGFNDSRIWSKSCLKESGKDNIKVVLSKFEPLPKENNLES